MKKPTKSTAPAVQLEHRLLKARTALAQIEHELIQRSKVKSPTWTLVSDSNLLLAKLLEIVDQHVPR